MSRLLLLAFLLSTPIARADGALPPPALAVPIPDDVPVPPIEERSTRVIAPGIELTTIRRNIAGAPLQLFITKVDPRAGNEKPQWKLKVATADYSVLKFAPVSEIAKNNDAMVAINGGYFAFGGAALGAVKIDGEWIRLPMKNRTAVGFDESGGVLIDRLSALGVAAGVLRENPDSHALFPFANLNGYAAADNAAIITPRLGNAYKLRADEMAFQIEKDDTASLPANTEADSLRLGKVIERVETGIVQLKSNQWLLVAHGEARNRIQEIGRGWFVGSGLTLRGEEEEPVPSLWKKYPTILGAGPRLLKDGKIFTTEKEEEFRPDVLARGPRTAFDVDAKGNWVFLVCDGREKEYSAGLSIAELALEMQNAGAVDALCLDGGGSSTLVVNQQLINRPSDGQERKVPNAILVVPTEEKK